MLMRCIYRVLADGLLRRAVSTYLQQVHIRATHQALEALLIVHQMAALLV